MKIEIEELKYIKKIVLVDDTVCFRYHLTDMLSNFERDIIYKAYKDCKIYVGREQRTYQNISYVVIFISIYGAKLVLRLPTQWKERVLQILDEEDAKLVDLGENSNEKDIEII